MWYYGKHRTSFWKKHETDILMVIGMVTFFGIPVFMLFTR